MINIQQLESTPEYFAVHPLRGFYKKRVPEIVKEFGDQEFCRSHVEAVVFKELSLNREVDDYFIEKLRENARYRLIVLERDGVIEKTGRTTIGKQVLYKSTGV